MASPCIYSENLLRFYDYKKEWLEDDDQCRICLEEFKSSIKPVIAHNKSLRKEGPINKEDVDHLVHRECMRTWTKIHLFERKGQAVPCILCKRKVDVLHSLFHKDTVQEIYRMRDQAQLGLKRVAMIAALLGALGGSIALELKFRMISVLGVGAVFGGVGAAITFKVIDGVAEAAIEAAGIEGEIIIAIGIAVAAIGSGTLGAGGAVYFFSGKKFDL